MPADRRRYRGVVIGLGSVARTAHLPGFLRGPSPRDRIEIVGAVEASPSGGAVDGLEVVTDRADIDRFGPIDFVDICTPTATHLELTLWALDRGYHVICEKPVAIRRRDARRIAARARQASRIVMPCHQYRFNPAWRQVRRWLDEGAIGAWSLAEFTVYRLQADRGADATPVPWRATRAGGLGGVLLDHGTHLIYELLDVAGPPAEVQGWTTRVRHADYDVEDTAQLVMRYPDRLAVLFLTWAAHHRETRIRFVGERGTISWEGGLLRLATGDRHESLDFSIQLDKASYRDWFADLFVDFVDRIDRNDAAGPLADLQRVASILEAGYDTKLPRPAGARSRVPGVVA